METDSIPWLKIFLAIGGLAVGYAWLQLLHRTSRAIGTITGITTRSGTDGTISKVPVITYRVGKKSYTFTPSLVLYGEARESRIGTAVPVAYNPSNPEDAEIATAFRRYFPPVFVTVIYSFFLYAAIKGSVE